MLHAKVELQPAYVLHTRPYRETSLLVDFITPEFGRISAVAKGVKSSKKSKQSLLQPFGRILISWYGKSELKSLRAVEDQYVRVMLHGNALYSGFYINELLIYLLKTQDHCETLFAGYEQLVRQLATEPEFEPSLRCFEKLLLEELGYGIPFPESRGSGNDSGTEIYYYAEDGHFIRLDGAPHEAQLQRCFTLKELKAIAGDQLITPDLLHAAKRLMRLAFTPLLGGRTLRSRELFNHQRA